MSKRTDNYYRRRSNTRKLCPECNSTLFEEDTIHAETVCRKCGLVLVAPPSLSFTHAGFKVVETRKQFRVIVFDDTYIVEARFGR